MERELACKARDLAERFFNKAKQFRRIPLAVFLSYDSAILEDIRQAGA